MVAEEKVAPRGNRHLLLRLWKWKCGLPEGGPHPYDKPKPMKSLDNLRARQWPSGFDDALADVRKVTYPTARFDRVAGIKRYLAKYVTENDPENIVKAIVVCGMECNLGRHPQKHFYAEDDAKHYYDTSESVTAVEYLGKIVTGTKFLAGPVSPGPWLKRFTKLMRNRMVMGTFRYGGIQQHQRRSKGFTCDWFPATCHYLRRYEDDGNTEGLVDAANMMMLAWIRHEDLTWLD